MDLETTYKIAYNNTPPFEEMNDSASNFFSSCILMRMKEVIECPENEFNEEAITGIDLFLYFVDSMKLKLDNIFTLLKQKYSENKKMLDKQLYTNFTKDKIFSKFNEIYKTHPSLVKNLISNINQRNINSKNVSYSSYFFLFITPEILKELVKEKIIQNKHIKNYISFLNDIKAMNSVQNEINIYASKKFRNTKNFDKQSFWKKLYSNMIEESTSSLIELCNFYFNNRVLYKEISINSNAKHKVIKQEIDLQNLHKLNEFVIGQKEAIEKIKNKLFASYYGFIDENRPIASFLLTGPTGVGKTETAKAISDLCFNKKFFVLDMTTFKTKEDISRLTGASPNYVGYGDKVDFCEFLIENPVSIILFEEIDKCHKEVLDILMRMLDEGEFINARGKKLSLKNTVIFCTTNLTEYVNDGLIDSKSVEERISSRDGLRKEIIGRFDEVIEYKKLLNQDLIFIATKFVDKQKDAFNKNNSENKLSLSYDNSLLQKIVNNSNADLLGARDLRKSIQKYFIQPVINHMIENPNISKTEIKVSENGVINHQNKIYENSNEK